MFTKLRLYMCFKNTLIKVLCKHRLSFPPNTNYSYVSASSDAFHLALNPSRSLVTGSNRFSYSTPDYVFLLPYFIVWF